MTRTFERRQGRRSIPAFAVVLTLFLTCWAGLYPAGAAAAVQPGLGQALVFGSSDNGYEGDNLKSSLVGLGLTVNRHADNLPEGWGVDHSEVLALLMQFQSIWYVEAYEGLTPEEVNLLVEYVNAGGNLYLTGERPCCESLNSSVTTLLGRVLKNPVTVGGLGDVAGPFAFNGGALGGVTTTPNLLADFVPRSPGGMKMAGITGVSGRNVLASSASTVVGGVWDESDMKSAKGRVALLMDIDWLGADTRQPIIKNLANFLSGNGLCSDAPDNGLVWTGGPSNCSLLTPGTYTWSAKVDSGSGPYFEHILGDGVSASCSYTLTPPTATYRCEISLPFDANPGKEASIRIRAIGADPGRQLVRTYSFRVKNDPRNVPTSYPLDSDWWEWPDQDKDGLPDKWETDGVWVKGKFLDLHGLGADPKKKDLFVRYDYQEGHKPTQDTLDYMKKMFADAPAMEGDQAGSGINLHIEFGTAVPASLIDSGYYDLDDAAIHKVGTYTGYLNNPGYGGGGVPVIYKSLINLAASGINDAGIGRGYVKGVFAWTGWDLNSAWAWLNVDLAGWDYVNVAKAESFAQASNANHELGHLLGLRHHNDVDEPEKCSAYQSIMSYSYSNFGLSRAGNSVLDYSRDASSTGCDDDKSPMLDWKVGVQDGSISFIQGQHGEMSLNFYNNQPDQKLATYGEKSDESGVVEVLRMTDRGAIAQWLRDFEAPAAAPVITPHVTGSQGNDGWYTGDVIVSWTIDPASAITTGCDIQSVTSDTTVAGRTFTCVATGAGGRSESAVTIKRDATPPVLASNVFPNPIPLNGTGTVDPKATDPSPGSGIDNDATSCDAIDASSVGNFSVTCRARDLAGNSATKSVNYRVAAGFGAFNSPLPKTTYAKSGASIPVKFTLVDVNGPLSSATSLGLASGEQIRVVLTQAPDASSWPIAVAPCKWDVASAQFVCVLKSPTLTSIRNPYYIAVQESGAGRADWFTAPSQIAAAGAEVNPVQVRFK